MINRRPYVAKCLIPAGSAVKQGSGDNVVVVPESEKDDFLGVYPYEGNGTAEENEHIGVALAGIARVVLGGNASAGKKAVLSKARPAAFEDVPTEAGEYATCGIFLSSGVKGDYVDMLIERGMQVVQ